MVSVVKMLSSAQHLQGQMFTLKYELYGLSSKKKKVQFDKRSSAADISSNTVERLRTSGDLRRQDLLNIAPVLKED